MDRLDAFLLAEEEDRAAACCQLWNFLCAATEVRFGSREEGGVDFGGRAEPQLFRNYATFTIIADVKAIACPCVFGSGVLEVKGPLAVGKPVACHECAKIEQDVEDTR